MTLGAEEIYQLFLALAPPRLGAARAALKLATPLERGRELSQALVPLAVDAALLGAEGVAALARAIAQAGAAPQSELESALASLEAACLALG